MRNRAKCKLCNDIIESAHSYDYQLCKCGEIGVDGGLELRCLAKDWNNFMRVDDEGNEIVIKVKDAGLEHDKEKDQTNTSEGNKKPGKRDLISMMDEMIKSYQNLPKHALATSISHYDLLSVLLLVSALFKAED